MPLKVEGAASLTAALRQIPKSVTADLQAEVETSAETLRDEMLHLLRSDPKSGRVWTTRRARRGEEHDEWLKTPSGRYVPMVKRIAPHTASAPGEPVAEDVGRLGDRIAIAFPEPLAATVGGPLLKLYEMGSQSMPARPFMAPALDTHRRDITRRHARAARAGVVRAAVKHLTRRR